MILQSLDALYDRLAQDSDYQIAPLGFSLQKISFKAVLTPEGELFSVESLLDVETGRPRLLVVPGGAKPSGGVTRKSVARKVQLLRNDVQFLLGAQVCEHAEPSVGESTWAADPDPFRFQAFREYHLGAEQEIDDEDFTIVCRFLRQWDPSAAESVLKPRWAALAAGQGVFQVQGRHGFVHERPGVRAWWLDQETESDELLGECLITGLRRPIARTHDKIKGVVGAQSSGATIAGFNDTAYCSYGKEQSFNAPVSREAAFRYVTAANALLDGPMREKHCLRIADMTVIFWTDKPSSTEDIFARVLTEGSASAEIDDPQDEGVRQKIGAFLNGLRKGREAYGELGDNPDDTSFYLLALAPNASRLAVRMFMRATLGELLTNLRRHYADIGLEPQHYGTTGKSDPEFPPTWLLLRQTARDTKDIPPLLAAPLLQAVLRGTPYPEALYRSVLRRIHCDRQVNYARASVIKGYLTRNLSREVSMSLDTARLDPPYRLGRLFAALEKTQRDALGDGLNTTIRERFYSSASATPGTVFPRLMRTYQHHLAKLEKGRNVVRERLVQEILHPVESFPAHLNLADQGAFALGYYHQMQALYTKKAAAASASHSSGDNE